jgi:hypothetical protein
MFTRRAKSAGPRVGRGREAGPNTGDAGRARPPGGALVGLAHHVRDAAGPDGLLPTYGDRKNVYMTHPLDKGVPATLEREVDIPGGQEDAAVVLGLPATCRAISSCASSPTASSC